MKKKILTMLVLVCTMSTVLSGCFIDKFTFKKSEDISTEQSTSAESVEETEEETPVEETAPEQDDTVNTEDTGAPQIGAEPMEVLDTNEITLEEDEAGVIR